ncbi:MAG: S-layer homology domain-containing protein [Oscillospiraceae bacterium]|nr:S-layer homology domain-containing protein [Oscillospiraceae bacterium]
MTVLLALLMVVSLVLPTAAAVQIEVLAEDIGSIGLLQDGVSSALVIEQFSADLVNFEDFARDLNALGLFQGVGGGNFALDRAPTRAEALVMLIRLLGAEEAALAGSYTHPFTDVSGWATPYIAFAYEYGLTNGTSSTTFGPNAAATAQQYVTFVLRALGYSDAPGGDFTFANALNFGMNQVGVWHPILADGPFLRGHVAAVSFLGVAAFMADEDYMLLEVLVAEGVVSASAAAPILQRIDNYDLYLALEDVLARSTVTGGTSRETTTISATVNGQNVTETVTIDHPLPTDLVAWMDFDTFGAFSTLVLLTEIDQVAAGNERVLVLTFRDAFFASWLSAITSGIADALAAELGTAVSVVGTPTGSFEERVTIISDRVTAVSMHTQLNMVILVEGVQMTINMDWPINLNVAFQG